MRTYYGLEAIEDDGWSVYAAMGNFDGIHKGHQALFQRLRQDARRDGARTLVITFDPHPLYVLRPAEAPPLLTTIPERLYQLSRLGLDMVQVIPFSRQFAATEAEDFVRNILSRRFGVSRLYGGAYFTFGRGRKGNKELIRRLAPETGCDVTVIQPLPWQGGTISSTLIRRLIGQGKVNTAARLLSDPFTVTGTVIRGDGRGRRLGLPTANLVWPARKVQPALGVYAVRACIGGRPVDGVANIGTRPTFTGDDAPLLLEVHLFGWQADLYGEEIRVAFLEHLRPEQRFAGVEQFLAQARQDIKAARGFLAAAPAVDEGYLCLTR